jgi:hypothetical protein
MLNVSRKLLPFLIFLILPFDAAAGITGSFSIGYQRAKRIRPVEDIFKEGEIFPSLILKNENSWGTLDADIGYNFNNNRWGIFLVVNRFYVGVKQFGIEPSIITGIGRTTLAILCKATVIGSPQTIRIDIEGGPSINIQYAETRLNYEMEQSAGGIAGISLIVPNRFSALLIRTRYILCRDYRDFNTSGVGVSLGFEFD